MATPQDIINTWTARMLANEGHFAAFDGVIKFVVEGSKGGSWIFSCLNPISVVESDDPAHCTITMNEIDFLEMAENNINPQEYYFTGKLRVSGDALLALRAGEIMEGVK